VAALKSRTRQSLYRWGPFVLLVIAGASRWIAAGTNPDADSTLASEALGCAWAALVSFAFVMRQQRLSASMSTRRHRMKSMLAGAMLVGGPAIALLTRVHELDAGGLTIALALTPVIIAITSSALGSEASEGIAGRLWPGLAATAGLLLLLAQPNLGDVLSDLALVFAPALTGVGAALFCAEPKRSLSCATYALVGAAALFAVTLAETYFIGGITPSVSLLAVAWDGALALLGIVALVQLGATRWSSQFTLVPLFIVVEGIVLVRPHITTYWVVGLVLPALASISLLLPQDDQADQLATTPSDLAKMQRR
jgi:hypothetical protein